MNRDALLAAVPANFNGLLPYQRKQTVEALIVRILDAIEEEGREPDEWESRDLAAAIGYIAGHWYNAALVAAERALTPPDQRAPVNPPNPAGHSARHIRDALAYVGGMAAPNT